MGTVLLAFIFMILIGLFLDNRVFQIPAAASILLLFAILNAVIGALTYFLRSWSVLFVILLFVVLNLLYKYDVIDPRNKAYGLNYSNASRPAYSLNSLEKLNAPQQVESDKKNMIDILNRWTATQE